MAGLLQGCHSPVGTDPVVDPVVPVGGGSTGWEHRYYRWSTKTQIWAQISQFWAEKRTEKHQIEGKTMEFGYGNAREARSKSFA